MKSPLRIFCAVGVLLSVPNNGRSVVIGGVEFVCLYFLSLAVSIAISTEHLSWNLVIVSLEILVTSVIGGLIFS